MQTFLGIHSNGNGVLHGDVDGYHYVGKIRDVQGDHADVYAQVWREGKRTVILARL